MSFKDFFIKDRGGSRSSSYFFFLLFLIDVVFVISNVFLCILIDYRLSHYVVAGACVVISVLVDAVSTGFSLIANLKE